jgi:hypothetical protein
MDRTAALSLCGNQGTVLPIVLHQYLVTFEIGDHRLWRDAPAKPDQGEDY